MIDLGIPKRNRKSNVLLENLHPPIGFHVSCDHADEGMGSGSWVLRVERVMEEKGGKERANNKGKMKRQV